MTTNGFSVEYSANVHMAQGVISVQARSSMDGAVALMRNTAEANDETVEQIAEGDHSSGQV